VRLAGRRDALGAAVWPLLVRPPTSYLLLKRRWSSSSSSSSSSPAVPQETDPSSSSSSTAERTSALGAYGSKSTRGSGTSLMGRKLRGTGALQSSVTEDTELDMELEAGDVLMEVLAEDHRHVRNLEFGSGERYEADGDADGDDDSQAMLPPPKGPRLAQRKFLTHAGVGPGTAYQREQAAARQRLEAAEAASFSYRLPTQAKQQREHDRRARARMRAHDVIENRIQEAMASGAFDDLKGHGRPLPENENPFEAMSGDALAHRVLKNAGTAPGWVEKGKAIRLAVLTARSNLALGWSACKPDWPPRSDGEEEAMREASSHAEEARRARLQAEEASASPREASGGWRVYPQPGVLGVGTRGHVAEWTSSASTVIAEGKQEAKQGAKEAAPADEAGARSSEIKGEAGATTAAREAAALAAREAAALAVREAAERGARRADWPAVLAAFQEEVSAINKQIDSYNLSVPASWMAVHRLREPVELTRALHEAPERAAQLQMERRSGSLARSSGTGRDFARTSPSGLALHPGPTFPSLWEAVSSAIFAHR
jgi:hypothetical protein